MSNENNRLGLLNRLRAAWKAFKGDSTVGSLYLGVDVKRCDQCDKTATPDILYICDRKCCGDTCPNSDCRHTTDINHAVNFVEYEGDRGPYFVELEQNTKED